MWFQEIFESISYFNLFIKGMLFMNIFVLCRESYYLLIYFVQNIYFYSRYIIIISYVLLYMKYCNYCVLIGISIVGGGGGGF